MSLTISTASYAIDPRKLGPTASATTKIGAVEKEPLVRQDSSSDSGTSKEWWKQRNVQIGAVVGLLVVIVTTVVIVIVAGGGSSDSSDSSSGSDSSTTPQVPLHPPTPPFPAIPPP
eukprot:6355120-Prymnesium_polylepis.1